MNLRSEAERQGLTSDEFDRIVKLIGREPNSVELGIFAVMWSEHCSYKSSKIILKSLPTRGTSVVQGPGENAGIVRIGDDLGIAFKIESHNHPSYIEPKQGAATGVGGILRDIFTMGARPVAVLDSFHFGDPTHEKTPFLVHGVVDGVSSYGNCVGIPTVGGEVHFDRSYNGNILVNVMAVGVIKISRIQMSAARIEGHRVLYLGAKTGRDGIHGATMASEEFGAGNEERRPTVQVGDPFMEKLVMEACLEILDQKLVSAMQDMGAAGLTCSTFEMSAKGGSGMDIDVDRVPLRAQGMTPYEIFLSESQERMLLVSEPKNVQRIMDIARKWDVDCVDIGIVTKTGRVVARHHGETVVDLPVTPVTDGAVMLERPFIEPKVQVKTLNDADVANVDLLQAGERLVSGANLSSRRWIYEQYDFTVGTDTVRGPGGDAAILRIKGFPDAIAMTVDSRSQFCSVNPYYGGMHVVAEAHRNLACTGARPLAVTNCLNFGSPEDPEVMGQFREAVRGMAEACAAFGTPITGGNVSFYNQTGSTPIRPTPTIGMIGVVPHAHLFLQSRFEHEGDPIALVGAPSEDVLYISQFSEHVLGESDLACPPIDLKKEKALQNFIFSAAQGHHIRMAHDVSSGGLFIALVEACVSNGLGAFINLPSSGLARQLFGEYAAQALVSYPSANEGKLQALARDCGIEFSPLGKVGGRVLAVNGMEWKLDRLRSLREEFFQRL